MYTFRQERVWFRTDLFCLPVCCLTRLYQVPNNVKVVIRNTCQNKVYNLYFLYIQIKEMPADEAFSFDYKVNIFINI